MLYLRISSSEASPKAISRRTSYFRVRLEFLRYPQVIPILFNAHRFGPPRCLTIASTCSWIGHPVSGLLHATLALFRLGFPAAPVLNTLTSLHKRNSLARSSISTTSHSLIVLSPFVNIGFQVLFHSPPGVLFTFPSRYCSSIGHQVVFSLGGWSPLLPTRFHVPCGTLVPAALLPLSPTGLLPPLVPLSSGVRLDSSVALPALNPGRPKTSGLGSSPFARRY